MPDATVEQFTFAINEAKDKLRIEVPQLRGQSIVQGTIMCSRNASMSCDTRIDEGILLPQVSKIGHDSSSPIKTYEDVENINPGSVQSKSVVDDLIDAVRQVQKREREEPLLGEVSDTVQFTLLAVLPVISCLLVAAIYDYRKGKYGNDIGNRIGLSKMKGWIQDGMSQAEVTELLGQPQTITIESEADTDITQWSYVPHASIFFGWQPDVFINTASGSTKTKPNQRVKARHNSTPHRNGSLD